MKIIPRMTHQEALDNHVNQYRILTDGRLCLIMGNGACFITGKIKTVEGREVAFVNGFYFELSELNITEDFRNENYNQ